MLKVEITPDIESLLANEILWNELARGVPFRETSWLGSWWTRFGQGKEAVVAVAKDDQGKVRGMLPLYRQLVTGGERTLCWVGQGDACGDYTSLLARESDAVEAGHAIGEFLGGSATSGDHGWDVISIDGVAEGDLAMAAFAKALKRSGASLHAQSRMSSWFKPVDADWDAHLKHFGKTQRRKMRRWSERVDKTDGMELQLAAGDAVGGALDTLIDLHQRRWNAEGQPGSYADEDIRRFVIDAAQDFARRDRLYLPILSLDSRPIGGELGFRGGDDRLYLYSSGYELDAAEHEPGRILTVETLLHLYREGLAGIDYLRGDEPYKKRMAADPTRIFHLRAVAPAWLPRLRHAAWCTQFELKQWARRRAGRPPVVVSDLSMPASGTASPSAE